MSLAKALLSRLPLASTNTHYLHVYVRIHIICIHTNTYPLLMAVPLDNSAQIWQSCYHVDEKHLEGAEILSCSEIIRLFGQKPNAARPVYHGHTDAPQHRLTRASQPSMCAQLESPVSSNVHV